jgi:hypothetical protein
MYNVINIQGPAAENFMTNRSFHPINLNFAS